MSTEAEATPVFPKLNVGEAPDLEATEIESMCMNCHENVSALVPYA